MAVSRRERREDDVTASVEGRYAGEALDLIRVHGIRVCHWRTSMTGVAWVGHPDRPVEAPHPKSSLSFAILAHETGHHVLGKVRPRWREEKLAWEFAFREMERLGVPVNDRVRTRYCQSMQYALAKALRRGMRRVPPDLVPFLPATHSARNPDGSGPSA